MPRHISWLPPKVRHTICPLKSLLWTRSFETQMRVKHEFQHAYSVVVCKNTGTKFNLFDTPCASFSSVTVKVTLWLLYNLTLSWNDLQTLHFWIDSIQTNSTTLAIGSTSCNVYESVVSQDSSLSSPLPKFASYLTCLHGNAVKLCPIAWQHQHLRLSAYLLLFCPTCLMCFDISFLYSGLISHILFSLWLLL